MFFHKSRFIVFFIADELTNIQKQITLVHVLTKRVVMLENATRTHEYSDLLSTCRSYSQSILSIWVRQRITRMILFHRRVRRPGAFFKVKHSDFFGTRIALASEEQSRLSKSPLNFISIFSGQRYFGKFLDYFSYGKSAHGITSVSTHSVLYIYFFYENEAWVLQRVLKVLLASRYRGKI